MDAWPKIVVERFDGEGEAAYERRSSEIRLIIEGFRRSQFRGAEVDRMEQRLIVLQEPSWEEPPAAPVRYRQPIPA